MRNVYWLFIGMMLLFAAGCTSNDAAKAQRGAADRLAEARADSINRAEMRNAAGREAREIFDEAALKDDWVDLRPTDGDPAGTSGLDQLRSDLSHMAGVFSHGLRGGVTWTEVGIDSTKAHRLYRETGRQYLWALARVYHLSRRTREASGSVSGYSTVYNLGLPTDLAALVKECTDDFGVPLASVSLTKALLRELIRRDFREYVDYWRLKLRTARDLGVKIDTEELSGELNAALDSYQLTPADLGLTEVEMIVLIGRTTAQAEPSDE